MTQSIGLGAAWPSPQIDASRITVDKSCNKGRSQLDFAIKISALAVPTLQGVHCPQDSCLKNRIIFKAALRAVSC